MSLNFWGGNQCWTGSSKQSMCTPDTSDKTSLSLVISVEATKLVAVQPALKLEQESCKWDNKEGKNRSETLADFCDSFNHSLICSLTFGPVVSGAWMVWIGSSTKSPCSKICYGGHWTHHGLATEAVVSTGRVLLGGLVTARLILLTPFFQLFHYIIIKLILAVYRHFNGPNGFVFGPKGSLYLIPS